MRRWFLDITPLRVSPHYRRLWIAQALGAAGAQMTAMAVSLQVFELSGRSTFAVGITGLCTLIPLIIAGLYGGAVADHHDRRLVAGASVTVAVLAIVGLVAQAALGNTALWPLYLLAAVNAAAFGVFSPARNAMIPKLVGRDLLPSAQALGTAGFTVALLLGPWLATLLIAHGGFVWCYVVDLALAAFTFYGLAALPPMPPDRDDDAAPQLSPFRSMVQGFGFLAASPNVRMTFILDLFAMVLAPILVFLPAAGLVIVGNGEPDVGLLAGSFALGSMASMLTSGWVRRVRRQGLAVVVCIVGWAASVCGFGVALWAASQGAPRDVMFVVAALCAAGAGASDSVSAVFRSTIMQLAAPDDMRGRLGGVFIVVVAGGPRLGQFLGGYTTDVVKSVGGAVRGEPGAAILGGVLCAVCVVGVAWWQRGFLRYDAHHPTP